MLLTTLILSSVALFLVLSIFMSKDMHNTPELSAYEDREQMLTLSGKITQSRTSAKHASN